MSTDVYSRIEQEVQQMRQIAREEEAPKQTRKHRHPVLFVISSALLILMASSILLVFLIIFLFPLLLLVPLVLQVLLLLFPILLLIVWLISR